VRIKNAERELAKIADLRAARQAQLAKTQHRELVAREAAEDAELERRGQELVVKVIRVFENSASAIADALTEVAAYDLALHERTARRNARGLHTDDYPVIHGFERRARYRAADEPRRVERRVVAHFDNRDGRPSFSGAPHAEARVITKVEVIKGRDHWRPEPLVKAVHLPGIREGERFWPPLPKRESEPEAKPAEEALTDEELIAKKRHWKDSENTVLGIGSGPR
jgi:hypothetical protein